MRVRDYLINSEYEYMRIIKTYEYETMFSYSDNHAQIDDEEIIEAVETLFSLGYEEIKYGGNYVVFQKWSSLDAIRGLCTPLMGAFLKWLRRLC